MRKLITICAVLFLMLSLSGISLAVPIVVAPPAAPSWWNTEGTLYAYGYWEANLTGGEAIISPPADDTHWASNYLENDDFEASIGFSDQTIEIELGNVFRADLFKQIYIYMTGTTTSTVNNVEDIVNTDGGIFYGEQTWNINEIGQWTYVLEGEIHPQPAFVNIMFNVPGMTSVTNIWAGENYIPEPATMSLLSIGVLGLLRKKKLA